MTMRLIDRGVLDSAMHERLTAFRSSVGKSQRDGAATANKVTRQTFMALRSGRPDNVPSRKGRPNRGSMINNLVWKIQANRVAFDAQKASAENPYWIIHEIGTGQRAVMKTAIDRAAGQKAPRGQPGKNSTRLRTVKSQRGRRISRNLAFGTGPAGDYTPPGASFNQQLYLRRTLKGAPRPGRLVIKNEIIGRRMVYRGGTLGFQQYRSEVLAAARRAFDGQKYKP